eukprot:1158907-Pelagomonas_calceolata.AAC.4
MFIVHIVDANVIITLHNVLADFYHLNNPQGHNKTHVSDRKIHLIALRSFSDTKPKCNSITT